MPRIVTYSTFFHHKMAPCTRMLIWQEALFDIESIGPGILAKNRVKRRGSGSKDEDR